MSTQPDILLNHDFTQAARMRARDATWAPSPAPGVSRRMLDRVGGEVARATSLVRYAPGSRFPTHIHEGGEEFLVLEGVFSDAAGDFPAGTYVRNPPGTAHAPWTELGCILLVKLRQMHADDRALVRIDTNTHPWSPAGDGGERMALYAGVGEAVELRRLDASASAAIEFSSGFEVLVLDGSLNDDAGPMETGDWARFPGAGVWRAEASRACRLYVKRDHL